MESLVAAILEELSRPTLEQLPLNVLHWLRAAWHLVLASQRFGSAHARGLAERVVASLPVFGE